MTRAHRRGPWIPEEDNTLMQLVQSQGPNNWVRISQHMHFRSPKQCRERFHQNLKPTLNHEPITADEGEMIEQMVADMGKRWAEIARRLGNRSDNAVKNWWNGSMNRRRRNVIQASSKTLSNRVEPLSLTSRIMPPGSSGHHRHSYSRSWTSSQTSMAQPVYTTGHSSPPMPHRSHSYHSASYAAVGVSSMDSFRPASLPFDERREQELPRFGMSTLPPPAFSAPPPQTYRSPENSTLLPNPFKSGGRPAPMLLLPSPQRQVEAPLASPVGSEVSSPLSMDRAPSLVSDHNSNSSISPKTLHSPRPDLLGQPNIRRGSAPCIETNAPISSFNGDEGYVSALPQSASTEGKHFSTQLALLQPEMSHLTGRGASSWQPRHHHSQSAAEPILPPLVEHPLPEKVPQSARDTRMNFSSLLN